MTVEDLLDAWTVLPEDMLDKGACPAKDPRDESQVGAEVGAPLNLAAEGQVDAAELCQVSA